MLLNWKTVARKQSRIPSLFTDIISVKKLTRVDFAKSDKLAFEGVLVPHAGKDIMVECHDGVYFIHATFRIGRDTPDSLKAEGGAIYLIQGDSVKLKKEAGGKDDWPLYLRNAAAELLEQLPDPLAHYSEEELEAALTAKRRGKQVSTERSRKTVIVGKAAR